MVVAACDDVLRSGVPRHHDAAELTLPEHATEGKVRDAQRWAADWVMIHAKSSAQASEGRSCRQITKLSFFVLCPRGILGRPLTLRAALDLTLFFTQSVRTQHCSCRDHERETRQSQAHLACPLMLSVVPG